MNTDFRWKFKLRIMVYTFASLAAAILADIAVLFLCIKVNILTQGSRHVSPLITDNSQSSITGGAAVSGQNSAAAAGRNAANAIIGEHDVFYRIFGVGIKWQLVLVLIILLLVVFIATFILLTRNMSDYINRIVEGIGKVSAGDFSERIPVLHDDEFAYIAANINHLAQNMDNMKKAAQEAENSKNGLITNVAHDLRTPLTSIIGYIDLAAHGQGISDEERIQYLSIAANKADKLNNLIEELFSFTKSSYGHEPLKMENIDLIKLLAQEIDELYPVFEEHSLKCEFIHDSDSVIIYADGERMMRVFDNLLSNAVRYGSGGKLIQVITRTYSDTVEIKVVNFGSIIPEENLPFLFEKFYKVDDSRKASAGGTGLGLSIAKSIVENHSGSIRAESSVNGTIFTVTLPLKKD